MTRIFLVPGFILASLCTAQAGTFVPFQATTSAPSCSQATTYLSRTSGGNEGGNVSPITNLICGLVTDGVITGNLSTTGCGPTPTSLDALYILAQQNSTDALLNICTGSHYNAGLTGAPTFTTYNGFSGFTSSAYITTGFNPSTATSPNFVQNSANYGLWSKAVVSETNAIMGNSIAAAGQSNMYNDYSGTSFYGRINSSAGSAGPVTQPGSKGLFVAERTSSTATALYWDGSSQGAITDTSAAPANSIFQVGFVSGSGSGQTISEAHFGAALGATLNLALYNRLRTYMTAVGVP